MPRLQKYKSALEELSEPISKVERRVFPVAGDVRVTQQMHEGHGGVDFASPAGTPVVSPAEGVISSVQRLTTGYGKNVRVQTEEGETLIFGHLQEIMANVGQHIEAGDPIGTIGSTGASTGPHLHFERRGAGGGVLDPWPLLRGSVSPNLDALQFDLGPEDQSQTSLTQPTEIDIDAPRGTYGQEVATTQNRTETERSGPESVNMGQLDQVPSSVGEDFVRQAVERSEEGPLLQQVWRGVQNYVERATVGGVGVILIIVGLLIMSKGLRQQTAKVAKTAVSTATGGVVS